MRFVLLSILLSILLAISLTDVLRADESSEGERLFALKVRPLFVKKCLACHGADPDAVEGGLDMRSRDALLKGGESFEADVLTPGHGEQSYLYRVTLRTEEGYEMPPKESEALTEEQSWAIRDWIDQGAPWPTEAEITRIQEQYAKGVVVETSGGLSDAWTNRRYKKEDLWAYQPLSFSPPPSQTHPIDWYIDRSLEQVGIAPAEDATAREIVRRLSFGLTGLPPMQSPEAVRFMNAYESNPETAVREFAEHLLSTKHYGEHFARHWLDVARYADTAGFANDYSRPNAWRYRDYVIRAFNDDKPYNEFVRQQVAGDEIDASDAENRIAVGFLRMGPWEQTGMSVFRVTRQQWLDDVTDSVGQTFLGHALQCAKCHDHKFDPVPTRDYYSMMAVFSTTQFAEPNTEFLPAENRSGFEEAQKWTKAKIAGYAKQRKQLSERIQENKKSETSDAKVGENGLDPGDENSLARMGKNISRHSWELEKTRPIAFSVYTGKTIERKNVSSRTLMPKDRWSKGFIEEDCILTGGDAYSHGAPVRPAALSAANNMGKMQARQFPDGQGKRRLALANWMVDPANPLTARVIVNRVWSWHFGSGIAGNPNNVGATGKHPTHPELLDFLADWFMKNDWSVRRLNLLIVTSKVWRRSSQHSSPQSVAKNDPEGALYATFSPRRLTAEEMRDAMLAVSGELNRQVGGIPCRPDINMEVAMQPRQIMGGTASVYEPDPQPEQRNRRSIYAEKIRGLRDPFLELFNQPGPDKSCELRETSTVAPQALTLINAVEVQDRALAFASRLLESELSAEQTIQLAFETALSRRPSAAEEALCLEHWRRSTEEERNKEYRSVEFATQLTRTVMAEKTGEPYTFVELMPAYEEYVPDLQPSQVDAQTRGLAQVCLVLFNTNEFAYLD